MQNVSRRIKCHSRKFERQLFVCCRRRPAWQLCHSKGLSDHQKRHGSYPGWNVHAFGETFPVFAQVLVITFLGVFVQFLGVILYSAWRQRLKRNQRHTLYYTHVL